MFARPGLCGIGIGRMGLVAASRNAFSPLSLFSAGEQGVWYDPSDLSTLFQDAAGTTPVTAAGQPVGRMLDKSGRGNHSTQSTANSCPVLQQDAGGRYYLACDGSDDWMSTSSIDLSMTNKISLAGGYAPNTSTGIQLLLETSTNYATNNGALELTVNEVAAGGFALAYKSTAGVRYRAQVAASTPRTCVISGSIDATVMAGITLAEYPTDRSISGASGTGGNFGNFPMYLFRRGGTSLTFNGRFYGLVIVGSLLNSMNATSLSNFMASKTGV